MILLLSIVALVVVGLLLYWQLADYESRWKLEAPSQFSDDYGAFFSSQPTSAIYDNVIQTSKMLVAGLEGRPISKIENAYRDPIRNTQVGGDINSLHMQGKAIDFQLANGLAMSPSEMASMGASLNRAGLRVIFYPYKKGQPLHVQQGSGIAYASRSDDKSYQSTLSEAYNS